MNTAEQTNRSFGKILDDIETSANALPDIDDDFGNVFALAEKKGEIDRAALKGKIDASYHKILAWEAAAAGQDGIADYFQKIADSHRKAAKADRNRAENHRKYMAYKMRARGFERLHGNQFTVELARISNPKTILSESRKVATAGDAKSFPSLVTIEPRTYHWDLNAIKAQLKDIEKKKPDDLTDDDREVQKIAHLLWSYKVEFAPAEGAE